MGMHTFSTADAFLLKVMAGSEEHMHSPSWHMRFSQHAGVHIHHGVDHFRASEKLLRYPAEATDPPLGQVLIRNLFYDLAASVTSPPDLLYQELEPFSLSSNLLIQ